MLIALDGLDASGKKTQTELLLSYLQKNNQECRGISFPTYNKVYSAQLMAYLNGEFGNDPQAVNPYAASSFFAVDRYCSYMLDWKKDYESGKIIVANRYTTGNAVHQLSKLKDDQRDEFLDWLFSYEYGKLGLPAPDCVIYLCLPVSTSLALIKKRCAETNEKADIHERDVNHLERSREAALYSAKKLGWSIIDCADENGEIRSRESIHADVVRVVESVLKNGR